MINLNSLLNIAAIDFTTMIEAIENVKVTSIINIYAKDTKGRYFNVNNIFPRVCGYATRDDIIGKTDQDLHCNNESTGLMDNDRVVIHKNMTLNFMERAAIFDKSIKNFLSKKMPLVNAKNKVIGVFGISSMLDESKLLNASPINLSAQQRNCLYHLSQGNTIKQIAKILSLSPRTVEHYLESVKDKLNCYSRAELIVKALELGIVS